MALERERMNPQVSIIIPTHNRGDFLRESIQSVLSQTFTDYELIVVDDGSTDHTQEVIEEFPGIRTISCPNNGGVSKSRNLGIEMAVGAYICFLDSDDLWLENKLEKQVAWMESQSDCQVCYTDEIWIRKGVRVNPMNKHRKVSGDIFIDSLAFCLVSPSSVLMRASLFEEMGRFDEAMTVCEDYDLWLRISMRHPFHLINEKLIVKRGGHSDQLSSRYWGMDRFRVYALLKLLSDKSLDGERREQVVRMVVEKCGVLIQGFSKRGKEKEAEYYRSLIKNHSNGKGRIMESDVPQIPGLE